jgi:hypothetical protein
MEISKSRFSGRFTLKLPLSFRLVKSPEREIHSETADISERGVVS